jgi:hypothetical protein
MHEVQSPRIDDSAIEQEIKAKGLTAPRVTPADIEANIASVHYFTAGEAISALDRGFAPEPTLLLTFCVLVLRNGFTVTGESACASPENFDAEVGRKVARANAVNKVWPLLGYALKERLAADEPRVKIERISRVAHEVNRAYCQALGDNSQPAWDDAPQWQRESARMGVDLHLMGDFGPEASHISWMKQKQDDGWVYGPVKDPELKQHPCMVPFDQLPREQQAKDYIFRSVVHALR